jgi:hypothetical protein
MPEESKLIIKTKDDAFAGFGPMEKTSSDLNSGNSLSSNKGFKLSEEAH